MPESILLKSAVPNFGMFVYLVGAELKRISRMWFDPNNEGQAENVLFPNQYA